MAALRRAGRNDIERVYELVCELESNGSEQMEFDSFKSVYIQNIDDGNVVYLLAEEDGSAVGFGSLHIQWLLHHCGKVAEVQELIVTTAYRGKGIGPMLLSALEAEAAQRGCPQVELCCNMKRIASNEFYGRRGFTKSHYKHTKKLAPFAEEMLVK